MRESAFLHTYPDFRDVPKHNGVSMLFFDAALNYLENAKNELSPLTTRTYYYNLVKLRNFHPGLECSEINEKFIRDYRAHLQQRGDKPNTVIKALSVIRAFLRKMIFDGLISTNPFERIKIGEAHTQRNYLTKTELKKLYLNFLEKDCALTVPEKTAMRVFLFSCFTGLRYSDLRTLDGSEIFDWKIRKQTHKTGTPVYIPIPLQARLLLPQKISSGPIFKVVENSRFNRTLQSAAPKLGYYKHIHCHMARHTFATTCITLGISLPATSKLLGHRKLETTLIYARYVDTLLDKEMRKFNKL